MHPSSIRNRARRGAAAVLLAGLCGTAAAAPSEFTVLNNLSAALSGTSANINTYSLPPIPGGDGYLYGVIGDFRNGVYTEPTLKVPMDGFVCEFYRLDPASGRYEALAVLDSASGRDIGAAYPSGESGSGTVCAAPVHTADGSWYLRSYAGGPGYSGQIARYSTAGGLETLYSFGGGIVAGAFQPAASGSFPMSVLVADDSGRLYGMASLGGANGGGVLYRFDPQTRQYTVIRDLPAATSLSRGGGLLLLSRDGKYLFGNQLYSLQGEDGVYYNTVFRYGVDDGSYTELSYFSTQDPPSALARRPDSDDIYILSYMGGINRYDATYEYVYLANQFGPTNTALGGFAINGMVALADGKLYGTVGMGGANESGFPSQQNTGSIFRLKPDDSYEIIHMLAAVDGNGLLAEGAYPSGGLVDNGDGRLLGMTSAGGSGRRGVIFALKPGDQVRPMLQLTLTASGAGRGALNYPDPYVIVTGQSLSVRWSSIQADRCVTGGDWPNAGAVDSTGSATITPPAPGNYIYSITCENTAEPTEPLSASISMKVLPVGSGEQSLGNGGGGALSGIGLLGLAALARRIRRRASNSHRGASL
ncbi:MAG: choice-of-anchor tandem repeat GloVer-containing protein [Solimonas sp.]